jgi:hypothetical protein
MVIRLTRSEFFAKPAEHLATAEDAGLPIALQRYNDVIHAVVPFEALADGRCSAVTYYIPNREDATKYFTSDEGIAITVRRFRKAPDQADEPFGRVELLGPDGLVVSTNILNRTGKTLEWNESRFISGNFAQSDASSISTPAPACTHPTSNTMRCDNCTPQPAAITPRVNA